MEAAGPIRYHAMHCTKPDPVMQSEPAAVTCDVQNRVDMTAEATAAKDAASAPTTFSLKPQHADDPNLMLVFR